MLSHTGEVIRDGRGLRYLHGEKFGLINAAVDEPGSFCSQETELLVLRTKFGHMNQAILVHENQKFCLLRPKCTWFVHSMSR